jgi:FKBP-type peptidyl-prolyl cis-trans isomerase
MLHPALPVLVTGVVLATACGYPDPNPSRGAVAVVATTTATPVPGADDFNNGAKLPQVKFPDGLQYADVKVGTDPVVKKNDLISVHYTGWLADGTKFDSSRDRGQPFDGLQIGAGQVIPGWDEGVVGMKVGGIRRLVIPAALGYGDQGSPPTIPPKATLVFLVEVVADQGPAPSPSPSPS